MYKYKGKYPVSTEFQEKGNQLLDELIRDKNLIITAGGDFHGDVGSLGELELPENEFLRLLNTLSIPP